MPARMQKGFGNLAGITLALSVTLTPLFYWLNSIRTNAIFSVDM